MAMDKELAKRLDAIQKTQQEILKALKASGGKNAAKGKGKDDEDDEDEERQTVMDLVIASVYEPSALQAANDAAGGDAEEASADAVEAENGSDAAEGEKKAA